VGVTVGVVVGVTVGLGDGVMVGGSGVTVEEGVLEAISPDPPCDGVREESSRGTPAFQGRNASPPHAKMITATTRMPQVNLALII